MSETPKAVQEATPSPEVPPLTYKEKFEMVRNLELKDIEDYQFHHPAEACPDLKEYFKDMHADPVKGFVSLCEKFYYHEPTESRTFPIEERRIIHPLPTDLDMIRENGSFTVRSVFRHFCIEKDGKLVSLLEILGLEPTLENLSSLPFSPDPRDNAQIELIKLLKKKTGEDTFLQRVDDYQYVFPSAENYWDERERDYKTGIIPKITFKYNGHNFEVQSTSMFRNDTERELTDKVDNPMHLSRMGYHKLFIDGAEYFERSYDAKFGKGSDPELASDNSFASWRKWCGFTDLVVGPAE